MTDIANHSSFGAQRHNWVRLRTMITLRWVAIFGQIVAITVAQRMYHLQLELGFCYLAIGASITGNLFAIFIFPENKRLSERENLGPTGVGRGVALPHARLTGVTEVTGCFVLVEKPFDFDAVDRQPVDLIFALFAPEGSGVANGGPGRGGGDRDSRRAPAPCPRARAPAAACRH